MPESRIARADRRTTSLRARIAAEIRVARNSAGLTLAQVGRAAGVSRSETSRIERGDAGWVDLMTLGRLAAVVGLDLWVRTFPGEEPLRDAGHIRLADTFRELVAPPLRIRAEVPVGDRRDRRAWDITLTDPTDDACAVELETRFVDAQAQHRRIAQKLAESAIDRVVVVLADTRANRTAVPSAAGLLRTAFVLEDRAAVDALRSGLLPQRSALIFVRVPRLPSHGSS